MPPIARRKQNSQSTEYPDGLKPYNFHKLDFNWKNGDRQATADCPMCGKEGKFSIEAETSKYRCWSCGESGNAIGFVRWLWGESFQTTTDYSGLAKDRGLLYPDALIHWGVAKSILFPNWIVPAYGVDGKMKQVYRYVKTDKGMRLIPTPAIGKLKLEGSDGHYLFRATEEAAAGIPKQSTVYLCEGPWDAMALWETLERAKFDGKGLAVTASPKASLLNDAIVIATPGCNTFLDSWLPLFAGKTVHIIFDSDHPNKNEKTGKLAEPSGYAGARRVVGSLSGAKSKPAGVDYLAWGPDGYDPHLPSGTDIRDVLTDAGDGLGERVAALGGLFDRIAEVPAEWLTANASGSKNGKGDSGGSELECVPCTSYRELIKSWRKALKWTDGLDHALSAMLASIASTKAVGDQLWLKIIGPAACGKSTLCEAVSVNHKYVLAKSTIRGFHSGFNTGGGGDEDNSLIAKLYDKTLVTKDGDTLLQSPNLGQILSEARDLYDSTSRTHYRNAMSKDYSGVRMTWLLCGTSSLRSIDSSELGERFLDCVIMDTIDDELEDEILWRVANRADRSMSIESNGEATSQHEPTLAAAMSLTGGYIDYLRENAIELLTKITIPDVSMRRIIRLGKFVAFMRARPSAQQDETAEREFAARLVSQHIRLAKCLAVVLQRKTVDDEVMRRVTKIGLDTARGQTLEMARWLYEAEDGMEVQSIALHTGRDEKTIRTMLRFLGRIGAVESFTFKKRKGIVGKARWRLTESMRKLYHDVLGEPDA